MRPHPRRTFTDPSRPEAWGTSDRNGLIYNHRNLRWQYEYAGTQLINKRILVGPDEWDKPNRQLGTIILPPDPTPIQNARPEYYPLDELWSYLMETGTNEGAMPQYLETSTIGGWGEPIALSLEFSTIQATARPAGFVLDSDTLGGPHGLG